MKPLLNPHDVALMEIIVEGLITSYLNTLHVTDLEDRMDNEFESYVAAQGTLAMAINNIRRAKGF
jgi:hypothetical protein